MSSVKEVNGHKVSPKDFYVDPRTGFVPPLMPLQRLPAEWEAWEVALDGAKATRFKAADQLPFMEETERLAEEARARAWRNTVNKVRVEGKRIDRPKKHSNIC